MKIKKTFTLVELIVVIAILAILSVTAFLTLTKWFGKSRDSRRMADVGVIVTAMNTKMAEGVNKIVRFVTGGTMLYTQNTGLDIFNTPLDETTKNQWGLDSLTKLPKDPAGNDKYYAVGVYNSGSKAGLYFNVAATLETDPDTGDPTATTYINGNYSDTAMADVNYKSLIIKGSYASGSTIFDSGVILNNYDKDPNIPYLLQ